MTGCLPIFLQMKGGGDHPTASDIRVRLQPESCRLAGADSPGVGRLDSEVAWTSLSLDAAQAGAVEPT
jgi:hypothetical protein